MRKRLFTLIAVLTVTGSVAFAQNVEQGKKFFYYERYKSAKDNFEKVLAANPNNLEAVYWLGQTLIELNDSVSAEKLYSNALMQNGNAPLLLVGMGQIELMKGKTNDARQRFETALSLTKSKDISIINAVGRANVDARLGDAAYAIEKLTAATQQKDFKNAETWVTLGDAYRKQIEGGNAVTAFNKALTVDPRLAAAKHKIGKVYLTQNNKEYFIPAFQEAIALDPNYAPSYFELYYYYFSRDINQAKDYYDKYLAVADADPSNDYEKTSILWAAKRYDEAISTAKNYINTLGDKADPRYYKLVAYAYDEKKDSVNAKAYMDQYFSKQKPEGFLSKDYSFYGKLQGQFAQYDQAFQNYQKAIDTDTAQDVKADLMKEASDLAKRSGNRVAQADWLGKIYKMKKTPLQTDLYNWGLANYQAGLYQTSDSIFCGMYQSQFPNEIFGYLWCARSKQAMDDSINSKGLAVEAYKTLAEKAKQIDSVKFKAQILSSYFYLVQYYNDIAKDINTAISYLDKVLETDPTNPDAARFRDILMKAKNKPAQPQRKTGTTSKSGGASPAPKK